MNHAAGLRRCATSVLIAALCCPPAAQAWHMRAGGGARTFVMPQHNFGGGAPHNFNNGGAPHNFNGAATHNMGEGPGPGPHPMPGPGPQPAPHPGPGPQPGPHPPGPGPHPGPHPPGPGPYPPGPPGPHPMPPPPPPPPPPYHPDDWYNPWATAAVIGATTVTAIAIGTAVRSVPASCIPVLVNGVSYQQCGSTWYQPQYIGTSLQYVVVVAPR
ncbi:hypothetical protein [Pseudomonas abietaniphila]